MFAMQHFTSLRAGIFRRTSLRAVLNRLFAMAALHRARTRLGQLDAHMLNDIGLSHADAAAEASRSVWDAPNTWRRG